MCAWCCLVHPYQAPSRLTMVTMCSRGVSGRGIGQSGKSTLSLLRVPSPSTLSEYPLQVPAAKVGRGASAGQGSRRGRLLRAQASEVSPPDKLESLVCWMSERCKQGHTCHVAAKRRSRYKNHLARRSGLIVSASIQRAVSIVWSRSPSVLLFASLRLHFPLACN